MERTIELQEHYGATVWTHKQMDELRRSECLCRLCDRLVTGIDDESQERNCKMASALFLVCKAGEIALSVTRCQNFAPKTI